MAKKFRFRLESVLKIRAEKVEEAKNALNIALRNRYEKEAEIENLQTLKQNEFAKKNSIKKAQDMLIIKDYIVNLDNQIEQKEKEKEKLIEIENVRRESLKEAMREEKVIEKLKEKKIAEHELELKREETNFLDEIATQQFIKNSENNFRN